MSSRCGRCVVRAPRAGSLRPRAFLLTFGRTAQAAGPGLPVAAGRGQGAAVDVASAALSVLGTLGPGARAIQSLDVAGGLELDMEITRYDPPSGAQTRFETNGVKLTSAYRLEPSGQHGTRLTQTLDAKAGGLTGRMLIPIVQGGSRRSSRPTSTGCARCSAADARGRRWRCSCSSCRRRRGAGRSSARRGRCAAIPSTSTRTPSWPARSTRLRASASTSAARRRCSSPCYPRARSRAGREATLIHCARPLGREGTYALASATSSGRAPRRRGRRAGRGVAPPRRPQQGDLQGRAGGLRRPRGATAAVAGREGHRITARHVRC